MDKRSLVPSRPSVRQGKRAVQVILIRRVHRKHGGVDDVVDVGLLAAEELRLRLHQALNLPVNLL